MEELRERGRSGKVATQQQQKEKDPRKDRKWKLYSSFACDGQKENSDERKEV